MLDAAWQQRITQLEAEGQTVVALLQQGQLLGVLALRDTLRSDAKTAVAALHNLGVQSVMLTGDNPRSSSHRAGIGDGLSRKPAACRQSQCGE